jgi:hypothetical protein
MSGYNIVSAMRLPICHHLNQTGVVLHLSFSTKETNTVYFPGYKVARVTVTSHLHIMAEQKSQTAMAYPMFRKTSHICLLPVVLTKASKMFYLFSRAGL